MKRKNLNKDSESVKIAFFFFLGIFLILALSIAVKFFHMVQKSRFNGQHRFTLSRHAPNATEVLSFSPLNFSLTRIIIDRPFRKLEVSQFLEIPIDGEVATDRSIVPRDTAQKELTSSLLHIKNDRADITPLDLLRLLILSRNIPKIAISEKHFTGNETSDEIDKVLGASVVDQSIVGDNITIQVSNAADTQGLGTRLARYIGHAGGTVVLITTAEKDENTSVIEYAGKKSYTVEKLSALLGVNAVPIEKKELGDVIIIVGKDVLSHLPF